MKNNIKVRMMEKFTALGLSVRTVEALAKKGFEEPTEIQTLTIPLLLENEQDVIAQAQTGTGKTAAFGLPLIEKLDSRIKSVQAIILAPTRELVIQVCEEINSLRGGNNLTIAPIYGGQSIELQLKKLRKGVTVVVGTPGRIIDHLNRKSLKLDKVKYFILDEADEMLNMGFVEDIEKIFGYTPKEKRVMLFSATMPGRIKSLAGKYMGDYKHVKTKAKLTTDLTDQIYFEVNSRDKFEALCRIIDIESEFYGLIFCRTRLDVDEVVSHLIDRGYQSEGLHGDISQAQRERTLQKFKKKRVSILVATDVAARGIDVINLSHVINYSIPQNPEAYVHRIGRTGRAGNQGTAITFVTPAEFRKLGFIKRVAKADIRKETVPAVQDIILAKKNKISEEILAMIGQEDTAGFGKWARRLIGDNDPEAVVASVLKHSFGTSLDEKNYRKITPIGSRKRGKTIVEEGGNTRLFIAKGNKDGMTKKKLVDFIVSKAGTPQQLIDKVEVLEDFSFITVPFTEAEMILKRFRKVQSGSRSIVVKAKKSRNTESSKQRPKRIRRRRK